MRMEPKKIKTDDLCVTDATSDLAKDLDHLFTKKFVYTRNSEWSVEKTSLFCSFALRNTALQCLSTQQENSSKLDSSSQKQNGIACPTDIQKRLEQCSASESCASKMTNIYTGQSDMIHSFHGCSANQVEDNVLQSNETNRAVIFHDGGQTTGESQQIQVGAINKLQHMCTGHGKSLLTLKDSLGLQSHSLQPLSHKNVFVPRCQICQQEKLLLPDRWECDVLLSLKEKLNAIKDRLSDKDMALWHQHTSSTNLAGKVVSTIKQNYRAELCTQAWCKFHELLATCDVVSSSVLAEKHFTSVHLCEAPGAFITSLNHYLKSRGYEGKWSWVGTTLNPYCEGNDTMRMIDDDRFIRTTYKNWFFGTDNTGDLMSEENLEALVKRIKRFKTVHLVTADGSIDCQENPAEQEVIVSQLHHCEVLTACLLLSPGGVFVIKLFTMFEASTIILLYILNCCFEKVTVCKPATSKSGNSEVYAVCTGYTAPLPENMLFLIFSTVCRCEKTDSVLLGRQDIPDDFLTQHIECCQYFFDLQSRTILRNLDMYGQVSESMRQIMSDLQDKCVEQYIQVCELEAISNRDRIVPFTPKNSPRNPVYNCSFKVLSSSTIHLHSKSAFYSGPNLDPLTVYQGRVIGTFQQRQQSKTWLEILEQLPDYPVDQSGQLSIQCLQYLIESEVKDWKLLLGSPLHSVNSSQFCDAKLLRDLKQMMLRATVVQHQEKSLQDYALAIRKEMFYTFLEHSFQSQHSHNPDGYDTFYLAFEGSITSLGAGSAMERNMFAYETLESVKSLRSLENCKKSAQLMVDITKPDLLLQEESGCQGNLLEVVLAVCSYLPERSNLVLLVPIATTRLSAGLLYILARLFRQTTTKSLGGGAFLHQLIFFTDLAGFTPYCLLSLLELLRQSLSSVPSGSQLKSKAHPTSSVQLTCQGEGTLRVNAPIHSSNKTDLLPRQKNYCHGDGNDFINVNDVGRDIGQEEKVSCGRSSVTEGAMFNGNKDRICTRRVPLELIPVLHILNDSVFARFLYTSNRNAIMNFINSIKSAELARLSQNAS